MTSELQDRQWFLISNILECSNCIKNHLIGSVKLCGPSMGTLNALCYFDGYLCDFNGFDRTIRIPWEKYVFYMGIITVIWNCGGQSLYASAGSTKVTRSGHSKLM